MSTSEIDLKSDVKSSLIITVQIISGTLLWYPMSAMYFLLFQSTFLEEVRLPGELMWFALPILAYPGLGIVGGLVALFIGMTVFFDRMRRTVSVILTTLITFGFIAFLATQGHDGKLFALLFLYPVSAYVGLLLSRWVILQFAKLTWKRGQSAGVIVAKLGKARGNET